MSECTILLFQQLLRIPIVNDMEFEKDENFEIELFEPQGGAKLGKVARTAVTITNDDGKDYFNLFLHIYLSWNSDKVT